MNITHPKYFCNFIHHLLSLFHLYIIITSIKIVVFIILLSIFKNRLLFSKKIKQCIFICTEPAKKYYFNSFQFSKESSMIFTYCKRICCFYNCNTMFLPLYCVQKEKYKYLATLFRGGNYNVKIYFKKIRRYE